VGTWLLVKVSYQNRPEIQGHQFIFVQLIVQVVCNGGQEVYFAFILFCDWDCVVPMNRLVFNLNSFLSVLELLYLEQT